MASRESAVSDFNVRMVILSTDDLDSSIAFYKDTLGMPLKFRDGDRYAAIDGGSVTIALATSIDHPHPGQIAVGIKTGDVDAAARAVEAAGGTLDDICRVDVYVRNMEHFEAIHKVRAEYFKPPLPASTMVEVSKMTSPEYLIEISAIAVLPGK